MRKLVLNPEKKQQPTSLKRAVITTTVFKYATVVLQFILNMILARLLTPDEYGIVAVVNVFTTFFTIISDLGIGAAVIQVKDLTKDDVDSIFSVSIYMGFVICVIFVMLAFPISFFYGNSIYIPICFALSISILFNVWTVVPDAILRRDKKFLLIGVRLLVSTLIGSLVAIIAAYRGLSYYSLVLLSIVSAFINCIWNYLNTKPRFKVKVDKGAIRKIYGYSSSLFVFKIINYFARNTDNLLTGKVFGANALGYYDKAYKLTMFPLNNFSVIIASVLHPILSDFQNDKKYIFEKYVRLVRFTLLVSVFVTTFCYLSSDELILIAFGEQWENSILAFKILSLSICMQMIYATTVAVFQSLGDTKLLLQTGIINTVITVLLTVIGLIAGSIYTLSVTIAIAYTSNTYVTFYWLIKKCFGVKFSDFARRLATDFLLFAVYFTVSVLSVSFLPEWNKYLSISIKLLISGVLFILSLFAFGKLKFMLGFIFK
jgi:teichuronic acid exporter